MLTNMFHGSRPVQRRLQPANVNHDALAPDIRYYKLRAIYFCLLSVRDAQAHTSSAVSQNKRKGIL